MDLVLRNARLPGGPAALTDIGIAGGRIAAIGPGLATSAPAIDLGGRLACGGLVESHIHLDKAWVFDRTAPEPGRIADAIRRSSAVKHSFTETDVHARACRVLARAAAFGTTRMRTQVELDPIVGLRGLHGVQQAIADFAGRIDVEICVFPEEGLTNNPGTDELLVTALEAGVRVIGGSPASDTDGPAQLHRIFELARRYDCDVDLHVDFGNTPDPMDIALVCDLTERHRLGGRVTVAHLTKLTTAPLDRQRAIARRMAAAGVACTVLPATDLFLMGRDQTDNVRRGVVDANMLLAEGVNACIGTNNVLNAFTPFGDASILRIANLYAHIVQISTDAQLADCFDMITSRAARVLNHTGYGIAPGNPADIVVLDAATPVQALRELRQPVMAFKRGRQTLRWDPPVLLPLPPDAGPPP
jgi:cytosine deaminase